MTNFSRPLTGRIVNVSISEAYDSPSMGFPRHQVNRVVLQTVSALFGQGATILFGHDWREDGVMEAVFGFAQQAQAPIPLSERGADELSVPKLVNLLPWPDKPMLVTDAIDRLKPTLQVERAGLPPELNRVSEEAQTADRNSALYRYLRARGLTHLRHRLTSLSHARLCLAGRVAGSEGRYPGVVEEALIAISAGRPLYLAGMLGGAARQIIDAVQKKPMPDDFCQPTAIEGVYLSPPVREEEARTRPDRSIDRHQVWATFQATGVGGIARANHLTVAENEELFHTRALDRVLELVLTGLSRSKATSQ